MILATEALKRSLLHKTINEEYRTYMNKLEKAIDDYIISGDTRCAVEFNVSRSVRTKILADLGLYGYNYNIENPGFLEVDWE